MKPRILAVPARMVSKKVGSLALTLGLLALIVFAASFLAEEERDRTNDLRLWFFNVGQGDSILIDTPDHRQVLLDGGPDETVLTRLNQALPLTDKEIDLVILTHNHSDHLTGLNAVLRHYRVGKIWLNGAIHTTDTYRTFLELIKEKSIPTEVVAAGERINLDNLSGIVLYPLTDQTGVRPDDQNTLSVVTFWQYGRTTFLLTGDAGINQEKELLDRGLLRPVDILKVGHQGSKTSSSSEFLKKIEPKVAVIFAGKGNQFGHPHREVTERLKQYGAKILRTDQDGTIRFSIWPDRYSYQTGL